MLQMLLRKPTQNTKLIDNSNLESLKLKERKLVEATVLTLQKYLYPCFSIILF